MVYQVIFLNSLSSLRWRGGLVYNSDCSTMISGFQLPPSQRDIFLSSQREKSLLIIRTNYVCRSPRQALRGGWLPSQWVSTFGDNHHALYRHSSLVSGVSNFKGEFPEAGTISGACDHCPSMAPGQGCKHKNDLGSRWGTEETTAEMSSWTLSFHRRGPWGLNRCSDLSEATWSGSQTLFVDGLPTSPAQENWNLLQRVIPSLQNPFLFYSETSLFPKRKLGLFHCVLFWDINYHISALQSLRFFLVQTLHPHPQAVDSCV